MWGWFRKNLSARQVAALVIGVPILTIFSLNIETLAQEHHLDHLLVEGPVVDTFKYIIHLLASDTAVGIAIGAILIAFLDIPLRLLRWAQSPYRIWNDRERGPAYGELVGFLVDHVSPSVQARRRFHDALVQHYCSDKAIAAFAVRGIRESGAADAGSWQKFEDVISRVSMSPPEDVPFFELVECIDELEREPYRTLCGQADVILDKNGNSLRLEDHQELFRAWSDWQRHHNAMLDAYEPIKRNPIFGKLYRPARPSRWGPRSA